MAFSMVSAHSLDISYLHACKPGSSWSLAVGYADAVHSGLDLSGMFFALLYLCHVLSVPGPCFHMQLIMADLETVLCCKMYVARLDCVNGI